MTALTLESAKTLRPRNSIIRHYKSGDRYAVLHIGTDTETQAAQLVYARIDLKNPTVWVRPLEMCCRRVGGRPRFKIETVLPQLGAAEDTLPETLHFSNGVLVPLSSYISNEDYRVHYEPIPGAGMEFVVVRVVDGHKQMFQWEFVMEGSAQNGEIDNIRFCGPNHHTATMVAPNPAMLAWVFTTLETLIVDHP